MLDVGAGDGEFARQLAGPASSVVAVEIDEEKVRAGNATARDGVEFLLGRAECLPVHNASCDLVCFVFSFHHVASDLQAMALAECVRVLRPGGRLHVVDPLPHGGMTEIVKPLEDETLVRTRSQSLLQNLSMPQLRLIEHRTYVLKRTFEDFEQVIKRVTSSNPARATKLPEAGSSMRRAFDKHARQVEKGYEIDQPCVMFHYEKIM